MYNYHWWINHYKVFYRIYNNDLSDISEDIKLLASINGATATSTWVNVTTADGVKINSFRSFIVSLVKSDGTVMRNDFIPFAQMGIARYNANTITCSMGIVNGLTSGTLYGLCAVYSNTAFSLWINHANYSLQVYGCK